MPTIPTHTFTPRQTPQSTVLANPNRDAGTFAAIDRVGQAIAGGGEKMAAFALRKQEAVNAGTVATAGRKMQEGYAQFQADLNDPEKTNSDETKWGESWEKARGRIEKEMKVEEMTPAARERVDVMVSDWRSDTKMRVDQAVGTRQIERAKVAVTEAADLSLHSGDIAGYKAQIRGGALQGLYSPKEESGLISKAEQTAAEYEATSLILNDPISAEAAITEKTEGGHWKNFKKLDPTDRKVLERSARVAANEVRDATMDDLTARVLGGEVIGSRELETLVERDLMSAKEAAVFRINQIGDSLTDRDMSSYADLMFAISEYDPNKDGSFKERAQLRKQISLMPKALLPELKAKLDEASDPDSPLQGLVARDGFRLISDNYRLGLYGQFTKQVPIRGDIMNGFTTVTDYGILREAQDKRAVIEDAFSDFIRNKPTSSRSEQSKFLADQHADALNDSGIIFLGEGFFDEGPMGGVITSSPPRITFLGEGFFDEETVNSNPNPNPDAQD